jgi:nucleotide-binding universal stress UspA family protein
MQIPGAAPVDAPVDAPVVVGVNGTAAGLAAVRLGAREAVARSVELRVLHAFNWPPGRNGPQDYAPARHAASLIVEQAVTAARRSTPQVRVSGLIVDGLPTRVLLQQSRSADLIILGDDGLASTPRVPIDSVLLQTVSRAWCPVVVARGLRPPAGPLLVAIDGSPASIFALRHAAAEAARRRVAIEMVHVVEEAGEAAEAAGREILDAAVKGFPHLGYARKRLLRGDPATTLVRASRHARMVIVGPRGQDGSALLGPVAQELLRRCACPTVFVHRASADQPPGTAAVPAARALTA